MEDAPCGLRPICGNQILFLNGRSVLMMLMLVSLVPSEFAWAITFFPHRAGLEIEGQQVAPDLLDPVARWLGSDEKPIPVAFLDCKMILGALGPCHRQSSAAFPWPH